MCVLVAAVCRDAVLLSAARGKLWGDKPSALGPLKVCATDSRQAARQASAAAQLRHTMQHTRSWTQPAAVPCSNFLRCTVLQDWAVPQVWFLHFYVLGCGWNALVLLAHSLSLGSAAWPPSKVSSSTNSPWLRLNAAVLNKLDCPPAARAGCVA